MPIIRTWADVKTLDPPLTDTEQNLVDACCAGSPCILEDGGEPPEGDPSPSREVRADLLRYLILGGCEEKRVADWGVHLQGAHITGDLDLDFAMAQGRTGLVACRFDHPIDAMRARFDFLTLSRSVLPGLNAQRAEIAGSVFLRNINASATIDLAGVKIGGQLDCSDATLAPADGKALNAQGAEVSGDVVLRNIYASATIDLGGAKIGGQLDCSDATFAATEGKALNAQGAVIAETVFLEDINSSATIDLGSAKIGGQLGCEGAKLTVLVGDALNGQGMHVEDGLYWRNVAEITGELDLTYAHVTNLVDDAESWPGGGQLCLDGFTYDRITASFTDAKTRLAWLAKGDVSNGDFAPQPYTQLAKVLRELGHDRDARKVLIAREKRRRWYERQRRPVPLQPLLWVWDKVQRFLVGYGHAPERSVLPLMAIWLVAVWLSHNAWEAGDFAPNSGPIQSTAEWRALAATAENPAQAWSERPRDASNAPTGYVPGQDWETFSRYAYAADLVIPIIDLGQTDAWAPSTERGPWGRRLWVWGYVLQIGGWIVTALGAAAITGIIRRD